LAKLHDEEQTDPSMWAYRQASLPKTCHHFLSPLGILATHIKSNPPNLPRVALRCEYTSKLPRHRHTGKLFMTLTHPVLRASIRIIPDVSDAVQPFYPLRSMHEDTTLFPATL